MATKKPAAKKAVKKVIKTVAKKAIPAKKAVSKKPAPKKALKKSITPSKKMAAKPVSKSMKKNEVKKPVPAKKTAVKPAPKPVAKTLAKKAPEKSKPKPVVPAKAVAPVKKHAVPEIKAKQPAKPDNSPIAKPAAKKLEPVKDIKVPKTSVKTSVPYNPEYKPLDQRKEAPQNPMPLVRYNDSDLVEFRDLINKKLEAAKKELSYLQGLITRKDEMGGDEAESRYMTMEDGSMSMEREQLSQMASRQLTYIDHLEKALIRIENKTYGICRVTGRLIDKARLRAVPHATLSLEAKLGIVRSE